MRLKALLLSSSFTLAACSTAATQSETAGNTTGQTGSGTDSGETNGMQTSNDGTSGSTDAGTTGLPGSTDGTTSGTSPTGTDPLTGTGAPDTTGGTSDDTTGETTGETTGATTGTSGDTETGTSGETETGGMGGGPCEVDADCKLHDDCCSCYGIPLDQNDPICKSLCDVSMCEQIGVDQAVCRFGQCTTEKVDCSSEVACDSLPPECPPGTLPGRDEACWTGACVPVESCDKVPDCELCPGSLMCVEFQAFVTEQTCLPIPAECGGKATCECAGEACEEPFGLCGEGMGAADLSCACPNC